MGVTLCRSNSLRRWPENGGAPIQKAIGPGPGLQVDFIPRATGRRAPAFLGGRCLYSPEPWYPPPPLLRPPWRQVVSHSTGGAQRPDAFAAQKVRWTHLCGQPGLLIGFHCDERCWLQLSETPLPLVLSQGGLGACSVPGIHAWDLWILLCFQESGFRLHSLLSAEFAGPSFGPLETPGKILCFLSLNFCIYQSSIFLDLWMSEIFFLIAHQIFSSKNAVLINLMNLPCVFWTQVSMRVMVMAFWKNLLKNMSPYNKFLQRVHFHIKILSAAVLFYTLQPLAVVLQSPEATVLKTWAWLLFGLFSFWPP